MLKNTKLKMKCCPFCGSKKVVYHNGWVKGDREYDKDSKGREPSITCPECGIGFSMGWFGFGISDQIAEEETMVSWNQRAK